MNISLPLFHTCFGITVIWSNIMITIWHFLPTNWFYKDKNHTYTIDSNSWIRYPFRSVKIIPSIGTKSISNELHIFAINVINRNLSIARCRSDLLCKWFRFKKIIAILIIVSCWKIYSQRTQFSDSYHPNSVVGWIFFVEKGVHV